MDDTKICRVINILQDVTALNLHLRDKNIRAENTLGGATLGT